MRILTLPRLVLLGGGAAAAYLLDPRSGAERRERIMSRINDLSERSTTVDVRDEVSGAVRQGATSGANVPPAGQDTATGTDPDARYTEPGYQDVSFGQAVDRDAELADQLIDETGGDADEAARRFENQAVGAPALHTQGWSS